MDSLRSLSSPTARVIRGGQQVTVPSAEVVPGDVIEIKTGDTLPADIRVFDAVNFETDEALLTGESLPVRKNEEVTFPEKTGAGDRLNIAYSSSNVTKRRAKGIVIASGTFTEIAATAAQLRETKSKVRPVKRKVDGKAKPHRYLEAYTVTFTDAIGRFLGLNVGTPLQRKLSKLAILLFAIAVVCAIIVLAANKFNATQEVRSSTEQLHGFKQVLTAYIHFQGYLLCSGNWLVDDPSILGGRAYDYYGRWHQKHGSTTCHRENSQDIGSAWRCHGHLLRQDRDFDAGQDDRSWCLYARRWNLHHRRLYGASGSNRRQGSVWR